MDSNFAQPSIPKFDGDYEHWSMLMDNLLRSKEYWCVIETGYEEPSPGEVLTPAQKKSLEEMKLKDLKTKNYLFQSIDKSILKTIAQKNTAKQLWESMKIKYQGNARVQRAQLQIHRRNFELLEMKEGESVTGYFSRVLLTVNNMRNSGEAVTEVKIVEKILRTLTEKFNYIVCSIEESKDTNKLTVDELQSSLLVHEQKFRKTRDDDQALRVFDERMKNTAGMNRSRGMNTYRGRGRGRGSQIYNRATIECFKCHRIGHFQYECPNLNKQAHYAELSQEEDMLLMTYAETHNQNRDDAWFLDSGCSNHMSGERASFSSGSGTGGGRELLVQHLLVKEDDLKLLLELQQRISGGGEDLSDLAVEYSLCPSKEEGGMLGWVRKGQMVPEFEKAAFSAPLNEVVRCKTKFGWHLLQVISEREESLLGEIQADELHEKIQDPTFSEEAQLIDVREPDEVARASLPGFEVLPLRQFGSWGPEVTTKFDPEKDTYVMCHHGMRSLQVAKWLQSQGFKRVFNVSGGIHAYAVRADPSIPTY